MLWVLKRTVSMRRINTLSKILCTVQSLFNVIFGVHMNGLCHKQIMGAWWLNGRVLDSRSRAAGLSLTGITVLCP